MKFSFKKKKYIHCAAKMSVLVSDFARPLGFLKSTQIRSFGRYFEAGWGKETRPYYLIFM